MCESDEPDSRQRTFGGGTHDADFRRTRPDTWIHCEQCGVDILRSERAHHEHYLYGANIETTELDPDDGGDDEEDEEDEGRQMKIGGVYEVRLSFSTDYCFTVTAGSEDRAETKASDLVKSGNAVDAHQVHSETRELEEIYEGDEKAEELEGW